MFFPLAGILFRLGDDDNMIFLQEGAENPAINIPGWARGLQRESTTLTLAEFYAPSSPEHDVLNQTSGEKQRRFCKDCD